MEFCNLSIQVMQETSLDFFASPDDYNSDAEKFDVDADVFTGADEPKIKPKMGTPIDFTKVDVSKLPTVIMGCPRWDVLRCLIF